MNASATMNAPQSIQSVATKTIIFTASHARGQHVYHADQTIDVPASEADRIVDDGLAYFADREAAGDRKRVQMLQSYAGERAMNAGRMYDVAPALALVLVASKVAEYVFADDIRAFGDRLQAAATQRQAIDADALAKREAAIAEFEADAAAELEREAAAELQAKIRERARQKAVAAGRI